MIADIEGKIRARESLGRDNFLLTVDAPALAPLILPGQFVMAAAAQAYSQPFPLLRRALAVFSVEGSGREQLTLLLKVVGDGTRQLAGLRAGDSIHLVGPLGCGFDCEPARGRRALIVAGGIGIASVYLLAEQLVRQGTDVHLIYGGRTAADLVCLDYFAALPISLLLTTEDGSRGLAGRVTGSLAKYLPGLSPENSVVYACGPNPMMKAVSSQVVHLGVPCQVSVETKMACGFGVCLGCSVKVGDRYRLACTHGPVFEAAGFQWEEEVESRTFA
jgi:dihydroorotate dehydrogenase electron transfer subunit